MPWSNKTGRVRVRAITLTAIVGLFLAGVSVWAISGISQIIISERQSRIIDELKTNVADSPAFLVERLYALQENTIQLFVPGMTKPLSFPGGMCSFDPETFPESFLKGLVYELENGSPVYHLKVREVREPREIQVLDTNGNVFYIFKPRNDYDHRWLARRIHPEIYQPNCTAQRREEIENWLDPSHVEMDISLIPDAYIETYAENAVATLLDVLTREASSTVARSSLLGGGMSMMRMAGSDTNIVIAEISMVSTGKFIRVDYPDTFTNCLEMFGSSNLMTHCWTVLDTNLATVGTNSLAWVDTAATNGSSYTIQFYAVGSTKDTDGDGINDGREALINRSNPDLVDSDNDGLVDGYSGVVTTNTYPGGITSNGSIYVIGELSIGTDPNKFDTDDDGCGDGWEVAHGHNPLDPNDPANVLGTILYSGRQTGTVWVIAVTSSNSWDTTHSYTSSTSGFPLTYRIPDLEQTNYWLKAWLDSNGNGATNDPEARGILTNVTIVITNRLGGQDITLADPDSNTKNIPDWREIAWFGGTTNLIDPDGDEYTNQEEYDANTNPTNSLSHPWNLSGTITYTGPQTGTIHVVACTNGTDWSWFHSDTITNLGAFTITHLPPNTNYWIRAWRDSNGDGQLTSWEAWGSHNSNPVFLDANLTGQDITLADPDADGDGIPDWWEVRYGLDPLHGGEDGAVAWWKLDEGGGINVLDTTANANYGVLMNGSNAWVTGIISNGLQLNGTNAYVEVPDSTVLKPNNVSVGLWIKPNQLYTNGAAMFLSKRVPGGSAGYSLGYETGAVTFTVGASGIKSLRYACALTSDVPIHVAGTFGGSAQSLYVNGIRVATTNYDWGQGFGTLSHDPNVLRLGSASGATPSNFFAGLMDDVRVYPGEWSSNEVHAIYELGADLDNDGLSNFDEYHAGTCPTNSDTDGDGILDGAEIHLYHTDPIATQNSFLPFMTGFEQTNSYSLGNLNGQQGWLSSSGVQVQNVRAKSGIQAAQAAGGGEAMLHGVASTDTVVTAEACLYWGTAILSPPTNLDFAASALVSFDPTQGIMAFNGNGTGGGTWITATNTLLTSQWVTLKVEQNNAAKTWKLYVNGVEKLNNLGFKDNAISQVTGMYLRSGVGESLYCDEVTIQNP